MPERKCSVDGCTSRARVKSRGGLCALHWETLLVTGSTSPTTSTLVELKRKTQTRRCVTCGELRPRELFFSTDNYSGRRCYYCRRARAAKALQTAFDENYRALNIKKYGMRLPDLEALFLFQGQRCRICWTSDPGGAGAFHVDHCHESKRVRGLLCTHCNVGLGMFKDSPALLASASEYLTT